MGLVLVILALNCKNYVLIKYRFYQLTLDSLRCKLY